MKTLLELYTLLLEDFKNRYNNQKINGFICLSMNRLDISEEEYDLLNSNFIEQRPTKTKHITFYEHDLFYKSEGNLFVLFDNCRNAELSYALRIQLLTNIIAELKECQ